MLLGVEKKRKQEEQVESGYSLRSQPSHFDETGTMLALLFLSLYFIFMLL